MIVIFGRLLKDILLRKMKVIGCIVDGGKYVYVKLFWVIFVVGVLSWVRIIWWFIGLIGCVLGF